METTQKQDQAILRISYLLASLDGSVSDDEKKLFRKVAGGYPWFIPGTTDVNAFLDNVIAESEKLIRLKGFYSDQEFLTAFLNEAERDCDLLRQDRVASRKGFAIWIAMCMADKDFSSVERAAISLLQAKFNGEGTNIPSIVASIILGPVVGPLCWIGKKALRGNGSKIKTSLIPDEFLQKVEELYLTLGSIFEKIEAAKTPGDKRKWEKASQDFEAELHSLIIAGDGESDALMSDDDVNVIY